MSHRFVFAAALAAAAATAAAQTPTPQTTSPGSPQMVTVTGCVQGGTATGPAGATTTTTPGFILANPTIAPTTGPGYTEPGQSWRNANDDADHTAGDSDTTTDDDTTTHDNSTTHDNATTNHAATDDDSTVNGPDWYHRDATQFDNRHGWRREQRTTAHRRRADNAPAVHEPASRNPRNVPERSGRSGRGRSGSGRVDERTDAPHHVNPAGRRRMPRRPGPVARMQQRVAAEQPAADFRHTHQSFVPLMSP